MPLMNINVNTLNKIFLSNGIQYRKKIYHDQMGFSLEIKVYFHNQKNYRSIKFFRIQ